jgi:hypothetical protein
MNLDSLKNIKFDVNALKNFSIEDVRNFINEQQVLALNIAIALGALIAGVFVINMRLAEYSELNRRLDEVTVKEEPAQMYEKALKKTRDFLQAAPSVLSEEELIPYLTGLVDRHRMIISELRPPSEKAEGFFYEVRVSFVCFVDNFHDALAFVNEMENSKYMLKINSWSLDPKEKVQAGKDPREKTRLLMTMDVSSMRLMENDNKK